MLLHGGHENENPLAVIDEMHVRMVRQIDQAVPPPLRKLPSGLSWYIHLTTVILLFGRMNCCIRRSYGRNRAC